MMKQLKRWDRGYRVLKWSVEMGIKRIIPCLDVCEGRVVKGVNFVNIRYAVDP